METVRDLSEAVRDAVSARHCGLVTPDGSSISLVPFPDLKQTGVSIHSDEVEYYPVYPGYLSSKNGPRMDESLLDALHAKIRGVTGLQEPLNYAFHGDESDTSLFARLIRGELHQWRIWEDESHIALLTPTGKTPGYTVVIPRKKIGPDVLLLDTSDYGDLMAATYSVLRALTAALGLGWCGVFFEGFEGDHAHVKLIPVHEPSVEQRREIPIQGPFPFGTDYPGFLTTRTGRLSKDLDGLTALAAKIRGSIQQQQKQQSQAISIPYSWKTPPKHALKALQSPWYTTMFRMQSTMYHDAVEFFQRIMGYQYLVVPVTTASISSPMGLGSDSEPLSVKIWDQDDYLADSQQFALEWGLRLQDGVPGVYYCGTSCRGEDSDAAHLNQFCHFECELPGGLDEGISVAERYIVHTTRSILTKHRADIVAVAGTTKHIDDVLRLWTSRGGNFPRVSLDEALSLTELIPDMWRYVVPERPELGKSLTRAGELMLIAKYGGAVWLTEMHHQSVPFYQAYLDGDKTKASCADFLIGLGEIMGCGARHETSDEVLDSLSRHEVDPETYSWYIDMRRLKPMKTVGWGLGIERYLCWIMQHMDVRDIQVILRLKGEHFWP